MKLELSILIYVQYIWHRDLKHHKNPWLRRIFLPVTLSEKWKHPRYLRLMCCVKWSLQNHGEKLKKIWTRLIKPTPMISAVHYTPCYYKQVPVSSRSNDADLSVQCSVHSRLLDIYIYIYSYIHMGMFLYHRPTKLEGVYWIHLVRPSVRRSVRLSVDDMVFGA